MKHVTLAKTASLPKFPRVVDRRAKRSVPEAGVRCPGCGGKLTVVPCIFCSLAAGDNHAMRESARFAA